jgi:hypothetical protein
MRPTLPNSNNLAASDSHFRHLSSVMTKPQPMAGASSNRNNIHLRLSA